MSWQGSLLNNFLRLGKWQFEHRSLEDAVAAMRLYLNRLPEFLAPPSGVEVESERVGGVPCEWVSVAESRDANGVVIYFHGGGFVAGSPASHRDLAWRLSRASGMRVLLVQYRLAPEAQYPAQIDDGAAVWQALQQRGFGRDRIAFAGDSAGANLALALALRLRDRGEVLPAALVAFSPWGDLTHSGGTIQSNARRDQMLPVRLLDGVAELYAGAIDRRDPRVSPVFADYRGLPPLQLQVSECEVLLDDTRRICAAAEEAGIAVECRVWSRVPHAFPVFAQYLPEGRRAIERAGTFLREFIEMVEVGEPESVAVDGVEVAPVS